MSDALFAVSPVDGRYAAVCSPLREYFSEYALIRERVKVEIKYLIALAQLQLPQLQIDSGKFDALRSIYRQFTPADAEQIKQTEKTTNHDVKAVEYFVKEKLEALGLHKAKEFVHFGLTSQDINNTATPMLVRHGIAEVMLPALTDVLNKIESQAQDWNNISLLAHTHGQPASPTRLGKEMKVFSERLRAQLEMLKSIPHSAKFGGATGNFNAHAVAYPAVDWISFADDFVNSLGLTRTTYTTQIEPYDNLAALFDNLKRINNILLDLCRDVWSYISMNYFSQTVKTGEIGSSAMPHKVNPIDFENAEGNLGIANALFEHLSAKLPVSRLQRDLTDSTVLRNTGVPFAHTLIALKSLLKGLNKILPNTQVISADLNSHAVVIAEAIQTILRREGYPNPYEALKDLTRGKENITLQDIHQFINTLQVSDAVKAELLKITPENYTGVNLSD
ncbi:MAG: adenylosuccinate lyase [Bacteroidetes bacterium]|nr:adenylosuccinate lyase [Bacteroidota bacterium]HNN10237.1 adenylosuccinate lyase [Bacteroidia bacterium]